MKNTELAPSVRAPTDSEELLVWLDGCAERTHEALVLALRGDGIDGADLHETAVGVANAMLEFRARIDAALGEARGTASASEDVCPRCHAPLVRCGGEGRIQDPLRRLTPEELARVPPTMKEELDAALEQGARDRDAMEAEHAKQRRPGSFAAQTAPPAPDLLRENARLRTEVSEAKAHHNDFVDEMAVKGPAWRCEIAELRIELTRARAAHLENAELLAKAQGALRDFYFMAEDRGLNICHPEGHGAPAHATALGTFGVDNCPMCLARELYEQDEPTTPSPSGPSAPAKEGK